MPFGKYPDRVKAFRKWSQERIDKASINDSVTSVGARRPLRRGRRRKKRRQRVQTEAP